MEEFSPCHFWKIIRSCVDMALEKWMLIRDPRIWLQTQCRLIQGLQRLVILLKWTQQPLARHWIHISIFGNGRFANKPAYLQSVMWAAFLLQCGSSRFTCGLIYIEGRLLTIWPPLTYRKQSKGAHAQTFCFYASVSGKSPHLGDNVCGVSD